MGPNLVIKLSIQAFQVTLAYRERIYDVHVKACFHLHVLQFLNDGVEMLRNDKTIYAGYLVFGFLRLLTLDNMVKEL